MDVYNNPAVEVLREWSVHAIAAIATGDEVTLPPEIPPFSKRREMREYLKGLTDSNRFLSSVYEAGVASSGLIDALHTVREQQLQLSPPKAKRTPYTPRHQR